MPADNQLPATVEPQELASPATPAMSIAQLERVEAEIKHRAKLVDRIHLILNKHINPVTDIDDVHGTKCRNINFAKKCFRIIGGTFEFLKDEHEHPLVKKITYEDEKGSYYVYEAYGKYRPPFSDSFVEASGAFSSRDDFFGKVGGEFKPQSEIAEQDLRTAAQTECFKKCIFTALGLGKVTDDELKKLGVDTTKTGGYAGKKNAGSKGGSTDKAEQGDQRGEINRMLTEMLRGEWRDDNDVPRTSVDEILKAVTTTDRFGGWDTVKKISAAGLAPTYNAVKKAHAAFTKSFGGDPGGGDDVDGVDVSPQAKREEGQLPL